MEDARLRRIAAVMLVLLAGAGVVWTLVALNAAGASLPAVRPVEASVLGFGPGSGPELGGSYVGVGAVLLAAGVAVVRWLTRRVGRTPPT